MKSLRDILDRSSESEPPSGSRCGAAATASFRGVCSGCEAFLVAEKRPRIYQWACSEFSTPNPPATGSSPDRCSVDIEHVERRHSAFRSACSWSPRPSPMKEERPQTKAAVAECAVPHRHARTPPHCHSDCRQDRPSDISKAHLRFKAFRRDPHRPVRTRPLQEYTPSTVWHG